MSDALPHVDHRARHAREGRAQAVGAPAQDDDHRLWGAYLWGLSILRDTLSHEFRTPLNALVLHCGLVGEQAAQARLGVEDLRVRMFRYADVMSAQLERLQFLLDRALDQLRIEPDPEHPRAGLGGVLADLGQLLDPYARRLRREFGVSVPEGLDPTIGRDPTACRQALLVLLLLAVQDLPEGGRLEVTLATGAAGPVLSLRQRRNDGAAGLAGWFPGAEAPTGPRGTLQVALRALELQRVRWSPPASPGEPIELHWHLEGTET